MRTYKQHRFWFWYSIVGLLWCTGWVIWDYSRGYVFAGTFQLAVGILFAWWATRDYKRMNEAKVREAIGRN
jgi:hypothetical protein